MNKKGNIFLGTIVAFLIWTSGIFFMPYIENLITSARSGLSCSASGLTFGTMALCLVMDTVVAYLIIFIAGASIGYLAGRK